MASESKLVKLVIAEKNLGFGRANNLGLKYALENGYDYIYLMNEDAWVEPDTIGKMIAASKTNPSYGILSPMQMTADKTKMDPRFAKRFPGRPEGVAKDSVSASKGYAAGSVEVAEVVPVKFVMAAHWLIQGTVLRLLEVFRLLSRIMERMIIIFIGRYGMVSLLESCRMLLQSMTVRNVRRLRRRG
jgi:GT2 family glycosyltransferase